MKPSRKKGRGFGLARLREPIEAGFGRYGHWICRHPLRVIAAVLCTLAALLPLLPQVPIDTSTEGLLREDDPTRVTYNRFRDRYGRDQAILLAIEGEEVFSFAFLERLRVLHEAIEADAPHLQDVTSLINARSTRGEGQELIVDDLLEEWPESEAALAALRERALSNPFYIDQLVSRDAQVATVVIKPNVYSSVGQSEDLLSGFDDAGTGAEEGNAHLPFLTGEENTELVHFVDALVAQHQDEDFRILVAGMPIMVDRLMRAMFQDMGRFTSLALVVIAAALALLFRRVAAVLLPLVVSGLAMLTTISLMALLGIPLSTTTQIMPSFLLAVGVGSAVHLLAIFYQAAARGESKEDAIAFALEHSGLAVVMTSLTTAGGLVSFVTADIAPIIDLGIITPIGILVALVYSLVLLPALLAVFPMKRSAAVERDTLSPTRRALVWCGGVATEHPWAMIGAWSIAILLSLVGTLRLEFSHDPVGWFPETDPLRVAMETMDRDLNGTMFVEAVIETAREDGIQEPALLQKLVAIDTFSRSVGDEVMYVGKTISIADVTREIHQALNENRPDFYRIPDDPTLVAQELLLFESTGADDLEELVDSQFRETRMTLKLPFADATEFGPFLEELERRFAEILGADAAVEFTGEGLMMMRISNMIASNLIRTYLVAFAIITPLMMLLLGSLRMGLVSMIPNVTPVLITLGIMGWSGIPLEVFTLLIASIALGLAVDDTVHFMHNFRRYYERSGDARWAVSETLSTTGQALLFTSIVLASGFFIYMLATMQNLLNFGLLTGITILLAFLADLLLAPALMALLAPLLAGSAAAANPTEVPGPTEPLKPASA